MIPQRVVGLMGKTLAFVLGLSAYLLALPAMGQPVDAPSRPSVTVVGEGEVFGRPDAAEVRVAIVNDAPLAAEALEANNRVMAKILEALAAFGIPEKDVRTVGFALYPQSRGGGEEAPQIVGYRATNEVEVTLRDVDGVGRVIDALVAQGANRISGVSFFVAEPDRLFDRARQIAVAEARRKAEIYARAADVKLGSIVSLEERSAPGPPVMASAVYERAGAVPLAPGELAFRATLSVTFAIELASERSCDPNATLQSD